MRICITGGAGFVGKHIAQHCLTINNSHITIVDDMSSGSVWWDNPDPGLTLVYTEDFRTWCKNHPCDYDLIFHCAAVVGGRLKIEGDPLAAATDLAIDSDFFRWCAKGKPGKVLYFSSSAVYPVSLQKRDYHKPLAESYVDFNYIGIPDMVYGWAKLTGEYLARQAVEKYALDVVIYRPFSGYGHDQALDYPFPSIVKRVLQGENPVTVWGSGDQVRDFIHIDDVVDAVFATMNKLKPGEVLNLGSGEGTSFRRLVLAISDVLGRPLSIVNDVSKPEGVFSRVADVTRLHGLYRPTRTLERGIVECVKFLEQSLDRTEPVI